MSHVTFIGPKLQIQPDQLDLYERTGRYVCEVKHDGAWCEVTVDDHGNISKLTGRSGKEFSGAIVEGLIGSGGGAPKTVYIAELEAVTEASTRIHAETGVRRLHVFDVVNMLGNDTRCLPYEERRKLLEIVARSWVPLHDGRTLTSKTAQRLFLVERCTSEFRAFYDNVMARGGEGLVLKFLGTKYPTRGGKTNDWIRCKEHRYVDYVVMSIGKSDGGSPNFQVGLFMPNGKFERVATIKNLPDDYIHRYLNLDFGDKWYVEDLNVFVGKVIECKGAEVHASGALRHGHLERVRDDKQPQECTLEATLNA